MTQWRLLVVAVMLGLTALPLVFNPIPTLHGRGRFHFGNSTHAGHPPPPSSSPIPLVLFGCLILSCCVWWWTKVVGAEDGDEAHRHPSDRNRHFGSQERWGTQEVPSAKTTSFRYPNPEGRKGNRPLRLVCLHGYRSNPMYMELAAYHLGLTDPSAHCRVHYLQGLHRSPSSFSPVAGAEGDDFFHWFELDPDTNMTKNQLDPRRATQEVIDQLAAMVHDGPVDGLMGFSQGAAIVTDAMALVTTWRSQKNPPAHLRDVLDRFPRFAILLSAACPEAVVTTYKEPGMGEHALVFPISCASLHVVGEQDDAFDESTRINEMYDSGHTVTITHHGGHEISKDVAHGVAPQLQQWLAEHGRRAAGLLPLSLCVLD